MKNGDLIVHGKRADELDVEKFTHAYQMTEWELGYFKNSDYHIPNPDIVLNSEDSVYQAYDKKYGKQLKNTINHLEDIFGQEWTDTFYARKTRLIAKDRLAHHEIELRNLERKVDRLRKVANGDITVTSLAKLFDYEHEDGQDD